MIFHSKHMLGTLKDLDRLDVSNKDFVHYTHSLRPHGAFLLGLGYRHGLYVAHQAPWNSPGKNTGVGSHSLLPGNLPHQGIKPASPVSPTQDSLPSEPPESTIHTAVLSKLHTYDNSYNLKVFSNYEHSGFKPFFLLSLLH